VGRVLRSSWSRGRWLVDSPERGHIGIPLVWLTVVRLCFQSPQARIEQVGESSRLGSSSSRIGLGSLQIR
jgi:hypothetical protein